MPLIALPAIPPALAALGKAAAFVGSAAAAAYGATTVYNAMSRAEEEAEEKENTGEATTTCTTGCADNPCAHLAGGVPGSKYRGGAHSGTSLPVGDGLDSHHTPAAAASPLPRAMGPAIQMDPADHWRTASNGRMPGSAGFIAAQRSMISSGNFLGAVAMDVADIKAKFGDKYDSAIAQMEAYAACLEKHGLI